MKRTWFVLVLAVALSAVADDAVKLKPLLKAAKTAVKNSTGQEAAEKNLLAVVDSPSVSDADRKRIYQNCMELERSINDAQNMKLYLKQAYDTATFFSSILKMHDYALRWDTVRGMEQMAPYRENLLNGGKYSLSKGKYADAYAYIDMYASVGGDNPKTAYWATLAAYNAKDYRNALRYIDNAIAQADDSVRVSLMEYKLNCLEGVGDSLKWLTSLHDHVRRAPDHDFFFFHLMDHHRMHADFDAGIALADSMIGVVGERTIYWFAKSQMQLAKADYDGCIESAQRAIDLDTMFVGAYFNKAVAYINKATIFSQTMSTDLTGSKGRRDRVKLRGLYQYAREPMEQVRALRPDDKARWAKPLYNIYLNLNLGDELAEIEQYVDD